MSSVSWRDYTHTDNRCLSLKKFLKRAAEPKRSALIAFESDIVREGSFCSPKALIGPAQKGFVCACSDTADSALENMGCCLMKQIREKIEKTCASNYVGLTGCGTWTSGRELLYCSTLLSTKKRDSFLCKGGLWTTAR